MISRAPRTSRGFSLIELLIVVLILSIVLGVVFSHIATVQRRYRQEESRTDMFQQAREAMDQLQRDLHEAGFPNYRQYSPAAFGLGGQLLPADPADPAWNTVRSSTRNAVPLVALRLLPPEIVFEGDVDQDGQIDSVRYRMVQGPIAGFNCPCLERSQVVKIAADPLVQGANYQVIVENVVDFDFIGFDNAGAVLANTQTGAGLPNINAASLANIETLEVRLNVQGGALEFDTNRRAESSFVVSSRIAN